MHPDSIGKGPVNSNDITHIVMNNYGVRNGVDYPNPLLAGAVDLIEQVGVIEQARKKSTQQGQLLYRGFFRSTRQSRPHE
jgi:hypothetical protein